MKISNSKKYISQMTQGADGSSRGSSSADQSTAVVCVICDRVSSCEWGHITHCRCSAGRCTEARSIPYSTWFAAKQEQMAREALASLRSDIFVESESCAMNVAYCDMYYNEMAPKSTVDGVKALVKRHVTACKEEVLRRLGRGRSQAEVAELSSTIADVFEIHQHIESAAMLETRIQPAPARERQLVCLHVPTPHPEPHNSTVCSKALHWWQ